MNDNHSEVNVIDVIKVVDVVLTATILKYVMKQEIVTLESNCFNGELETRQLVTLISKKAYGSFKHLSSL